MAVLRVLEASERKARRYRVEWWSPDGKHRSRTFPTRRAAQAFLHEVETSKHRGTYRDPGRARQTLRDYLQDWLAKAKHLRPATRALYRRTADRHLLPVLGDRRLAELDRQACRAFVSERAGVLEGALSNLVSSEEDVKGVVQKVALGEADAGVVYVTDVTGPVAPDLRTVAIPDPFNVEAVYPKAVVAGSPHPALAAEFVELVTGPEGRCILAARGFLPPPGSPPSGGRHPALAPPDGPGGPRSGSGREGPPAGGGPGPGRPGVPGPPPGRHRPPGRLGAGPGSGGLPGSRGTGPGSPSGPTPRWWPR